MLQQWYRESLPSCPVLSRGSYVQRNAKYTAVTVTKCQTESSVQWVSRSRIYTVRERRNKRCGSDLLILQKPQRKINVLSLSALYDAKGLPAASEKLEETRKKFPRFVTSRDIRTLSAWIR